MQDYFWPEAELGERCADAWTATVMALPVGTRVTGVVVGRQRFGVFIELDQVPDAIGLVRVTAWPTDQALPARGTVVEGEVLWHEDGNHQVTVTPRRYGSNGTAVELAGVSAAQFAAVRRKLALER
ncbi:hypothetical protein ACIA5E_10680 [Nocardia asteroides]|uniref:hypothetical protein n=1 Tax=Nocardia asteroides TaxID=1824 RepID=UPI00378E4E86